MRICISLLPSQPWTWLDFLVNLMDRKDYFHPHFSKKLEAEHPATYSLLICVFSVHVFLCPFGTSFHWLVFFLLLCRTSWYIGLLTLCLLCMSQIFFHRRWSVSWHVNVPYSRPDLYLVLQGCPCVVPAIFLDGRKNFPMFLRNF